jgi:acyl-CoA thioesterase FadM
VGIGDGGADVVMGPVDEVGVVTTGGATVLVVTTGGATVLVANAELTQVQIDRPADKPCKIEETLPPQAEETQGRAAA